MGMRPLLNCKQNLKRFSGIFRDGKLISKNRNPQICRIRQIIKISFNPITADFKVWSQAYERSAEYISAVSEVFAADKEHAVTKFRRQYIKTVNENRERNKQPLLTEDEEITIEDNIDRAKEEAGVDVSHIATTTEDNLPVDFRPL